MRDSKPRLNPLAAVENFEILYKSTYCLLAGSEIPLKYPLYVSPKLSWKHRTASLFCSRSIQGSLGRISALVMPCMVTMSTGQDTFRARSGSSGENRFSGRVAGKWLCEIIAAFMINALREEGALRLFFGRSSFPPPFSRGKPVIPRPFPGDDGFAFSPYPQQGTLLEGVNS